jgi:acyl-lipid omega-6 desaturase (Delta-12 desaturase)
MAAIYNSTMPGVPLELSVIEPKLPRLNRSDYGRIRAALVFRPTFAFTFAIIVLDAGLLVFAALLLGDGGGPAFAASQVLLCIVFFNSFSIMHECGHSSASRHRIVNTLVGHLASTFCFIPYFPWKYIHQKHHTWTGNLEHDPVLHSLRTWRAVGVPWIVRICWWTWIPVSALSQHIIYLTYPYRMWQAGEATTGRLVRMLASLLWLPVSYFALHRLAPDLVRPSNLWLAILLFLIMEELVNLPHHVELPTVQTKLPAWEQFYATRSCYYPPVVSELLVLNFNFHIEHHLFPSLPWYRLRRARVLVRAALEERYQEAVGIGWNIERRKLDLEAIMGKPTLIKQP